MGVKNLTSLNKSFLCKWSWHNANERGVFWNEVIMGKYREKEGGWCSYVLRGVYEVGIVKISKEVGALSVILSFVGGEWSKSKVFEG